MATLQNMRNIRRYTIRRRVEEVINSANTDNFIITNNEGAGEGNIENDESDTTVHSNDSDDLEENKENSSSDDESKNDLLELVFIWLRRASYNNRNKRGRDIK